MSGGGGGGRGGSFSRRGPMGRANPSQQQASNGLAKATPADSPRYGPRYEARTVTQRPASVGNLATMAVGLVPGGSALQQGIAALKGTPGDPYSGASGTTTGFSFSGADRTARTRRKQAATARSGLAAVQRPAAAPASRVGGFAGGGDTLG